MSWGIGRIEVPELLGNKGNTKALELGLKTLLTSLGHQSAGALTLFNYPTWMRNVTAQNEDGTDRPDTVDMASLESKMIDSRCKIEVEVVWSFCVGLSELTALWSCSLPRPGAAELSFQRVPEEDVDADDKEVGGLDHRQGDAGNHP